MCIRDRTNVDRSGPLLYKIYRPQALTSFLSLSLIHIFLFSPSHDLKKKPVYKQQIYTKRGGVLRGKSVQRCEACRPTYCWKSVDGDISQEIRPGGNCLFDLPVDVGSESTKSLRFYKAVSYTHLDVYNRQHECRYNNKWQFVVKNYC